LKFQNIWEFFFRSGRRLDRAGDRKNFRFSEFRHPKPEILKVVFPIFPGKGFLAVGFILINPKLSCNFRQKSKFGKLMGKSHKLREFGKYRNLLKDWNFGKKSISVENFNSDQAFDFWKIFQFLSKFGILIQISILDKNFGQKKSKFQIMRIFVTLKKISPLKFCVIKTAFIKCFHLIGIIVITKIFSRILPKKDPKIGG